MKPILKTPYKIVSEVLEIDEKALSEYSSIGEVPNWDSLKHIEIIGELETNYEIQIPNNDIEKYTTMSAIIELYDSLSTR